MACWMLLKCVGRDLRKLCILVNASMAVPSTTSMTTQPNNVGIKRICEICTQIAPPIEWPTIIICGGLSGYIISSTLDTSLKFNETKTVKHLDNLIIQGIGSAYVANVSADKSSSSAVCESPWPLKSIAIQLQWITAVISVCWVHKMEIKIFAVSLPIAYDTHNE